MLKIYNSIFREKQEFIPINPNTINMYVCGVTVYDHCHIGHARTYIFFDTVARYLRYNGYTVNLIRNITDLDDKILEKAKRLGRSPQDLTTHFIKEMQHDFRALNLLPPTIEPKATEYIEEMINLINELLIKDYAYIGSNGDVFYNVSKFADYGNLAKRDLHNTRATERVISEVQAAKHNNHDFALWKLVPDLELGWDSPWGYGRPGWHTECAAMCLKLLFGGTCDIHGGGFDLMFPHHENEIAQAEVITGKTFANYWMHVGFLQVNQQKMSKSLQNFSTIKEVITAINPEVLRLFMLTSHYRSQIEFENSKLALSKNSLEKLYLSLRGVSKIHRKDPASVSRFNEDLDGYLKRFKEAMDDDFNTPLALSVLFELAKQLNIFKEQALNFDKSLEKYLFTEIEYLTNARSLDLNAIFEQELLLIKINLTAEALVSMGNAMGLLYMDPEEFFTSKIADLNDSDLKCLSPAQIEEFILQRNQARETKNWQMADLIRDQLLNQGIILEDRAGQTWWRRKSEI